MPSVIVARRLVLFLLGLTVVVSSVPSASPVWPPAPVAAQAATPSPHSYYVTQNRFSSIARIDLDTGGHATLEDSDVGNLPTDGPDSIVYDHEGHLIVSNSGGGTLSEIDPATRTVTRATINTTPIPTVADMALDPASDTIWAIAWNGTTMWRVNLATGAAQAFTP